MQQYIFISYSYKNKNEVLKTVTRLQQLEFRVWYDSNAETDNAFTENSKLHIEDCSYFWAFMSSDYLASEKCRDELNHAHDKGKPRLIIYLNEMQIPNALNSIPSIHKYAYRSEPDFYQKIIEVKSIDVCRVTPNHISSKPTASVPVPVPSAPPEPAAPVSTPQNEQPHGGFLTDSGGKKKAVAAVICCIISFLLLQSAPFVSLILSIAAIVLSSMSKNNGYKGGARTFAKVAGIVCLIISVPGVLVSLMIKQVLNGIDEIGYRGVNWIDYIFEYIFDKIKSIFI